MCVWLIISHMTHDDDVSMPGGKMYATQVMSSGSAASLIMSFEHLETLVSVSVIRLTVMCVYLDVIINHPEARMRVD